MSDAYAASGVNIDAGNEAVSRYREVLASRRDPRVLEGIGAFGGCFELGAYREPVLVASTDGVGTKVLVAAALGRYDTIGRDLVGHCVNDILCANARPLFFLDYYATGKLDPGIAASVVSGVSQACSEFGVALLGGETAEMPGVYAAGVFDIAGTIVGVVERDQMIDTANVAAGDVIIGLPSNGFHTNGYSLVRSVLARERWGERVAGESTTIADALLAVHPGYLPYVDAVQKVGVRIGAMAHITGGGLVDNVPRILPEGLAARFHRSTWSVPPIVAQVVRDGKIREAEAFRAFNMGVGFCIIVARKDADAALSAARLAIQARPIPGAERATASIVGEIEPRRGQAVIID